VDVGSIEFLHRRILDERDKGTPVVVVSTELDEITQLSDRIAVMYRGRILGIVPGNENRDVLGLMMGGLDAEAAREAVAEGARTTDSELAEEGDLV
jgi:simple sugar transport system ATP-binding protein